MTATAALVLLSMLGVSPVAASPKATRVLLLPLPPDADPNRQAIHDALAARLAATPGLTRVPADRLKAMPPPVDDGALAAEIDQTLSRVKDAYRRLDIEEATRLLQSLENARLSELGCPERIALAGEISFWLGVVYAAKKDTAHATDRFASVLSVDPARRIDRAYFPPQTVALFESVRRRLDAAPTGGLSLSAEPEAAQVFLDGRAAGQAPVTLTASGGDHFICVREVGWKDWAARLRWTAGKVDTQKIYLQRAAGDDASRQLAVVLSGRPPRLDQPGHVEALGAALSADVVAELEGQSRLAWRAVLAPAEPHDFSAPAEDASAEQTAEALVVGLVGGLGLASPAAPEPALPPSPPRFELEVTLLGGVPLSLGKGELVGGQVGLWWYPLEALGVGLRAGVGKSFSDVGLIDPGVGLVVATAPGQVDAPFSLDLRWSFVHTPAWRVGLEAGARLRLDTYGPPVPLTNPSPMAPIVTIPGAPTPLSLILLGPHLTAGAAYAVSPAVGLTLGVDYGAEFALQPAEAVASIKVGSANPRTTPVRSDSLRHLLSLDLGVVIRFR